MAQHSVLRATPFLNAPPTSLRNGQLRDPRQHACRPIRRVSWIANSRPHMNHLAISKAQNQPPGQKLKTDDGWEGRGEAFPGLLALKTSLIVRAIVARCC